MSSASSRFRSRTVASLFALCAAIGVTGTALAQPSTAPSTGAPPTTLPACTPEAAPQAPAIRVYVILLGHNGKALLRDPDRASIWAQSKDGTYRETGAGKPCFSFVVETPSVKVRANASVLYRGAERELTAADYTNPASPMQFQLRDKKPEWFDDNGPIPLDKLPDSERRELLASVASATTNASDAVAELELRSTAKLFDARPGFFAKQFITFQVGDDCTASCITADRLASQPKAVTSWLAACARCSSRT